MTEEEIVNLLNNKRNGENNKKLLEFCREPKTYQQMRKTGIEGDVLKTLVELKKAGAIAWESGKYYATKEGLRILDSLATSST